MIKRGYSFAVWPLVIAMLISPLAAFSQTRIQLRKNRYSERDDVQLGRQAAAEIERQIRLLRDAETTDYVRRIGNRLVDAIPREYQHAQFDYDFKVVQAKEINAFALPGGPMYVNTGMILAAKNEGEMAGVMAHEIAHVALRHGTAQATKAAPYQTLGALGQIAGAILGGTLGGVVGAGSQIGFGVYLLKFSREYETEADIVGAQIMARAGYDPRDLGEMFRTIERQGGSGPEFLSSHPNPANRYERIEEESRRLRFNGPSRGSSDFRRIQARLGNISPQDSSREPYRDRPTNSGRLGRVDYPSSRYRTYSNNNLFRINVPENWRDLEIQDEIWFAPEGAYGQYRERSVFTHGVNLGVARPLSRNLQRATNELINGLLQGNSNMRSRSKRQTTLAQHNAYYSSFTNFSEATGEQEIIEVYTMMLRDGELFYVITVVPESEYRDYQPTFQRILGSLSLRD